MRLAVIASHPIQYHAPWYRHLATMVDLHVYYAHRASAADQGRAGFEVEFEWDVPLLEGYTYAFLRNHARHPAVNRFFGCNTPEVRDEIRRGGFNAVLVNGWNLLSYWQAVRAAKAYRIPVLARGDSQLCSPRTRVLVAAKRMVYPRMLAQFDAFLSVGRSHTEYLKHYGVRDEIIFCVPHSVDNDFFRAAAQRAQQQGQPRLRFSLPEGLTVFLFVGKLVPKKRPFDFLEALDMLRARGVPVCGLLIGDGPLRSELEAHIRGRGTPCVTGGFLNQGEIGTAYAAADALVLPSDGGETWGLVVNEAMACGLPAVVSNAAGCAGDLVRHEETGVVYDCGRIGELAEAMERMALDRDFRAHVAANAARHVAAYSTQASCAAVVNALHQVCGVRVR